MLNDLAIVLASQLRYEEAVLAFQEGADHARTVGNAVREAQARLNLAITVRKLGDPARAIGTLTEATALLDRHDQRSRPHAAPEPMSARIRRSILLCLGSSQREAGRLDEARRSLAEVMSLAEAAGDGHQVALVWEALGKLHLDSGEPGEAARCYRTVLGVFEARGDQEGTATILRYLGEALAAAVDPQGAADAWGRACALYAKLGDPRLGELQDLRAGLAASCG
jgi:tetratricopeptide (TPR) repeat protein